MPQEGELMVEDHEIWEARERALREIHAREEFGDCIEDGEPYPCKTIRVLDWRP